MTDCITIPMTPERLAEIEARADVPALLVEVRRLQDAVERVRALHVPVEVEPSDTICRECSVRLPTGRYFGKLVEHPCPTITALDGDNHPLVAPEEQP